MAEKIRLDSAGIAEVLRSAGVAADVAAMANSVAGNVDAQTHDGPAPVVVNTYTTDRAAASVTIAHPAGLPLEAKYGTLARAAAAEGLEVTARR